MLIHTDGVSTRKVVGRNDTNNEGINDGPAYVLDRRYCFGENLSSTVFCERLAS